MSHCAVCQGDEMNVSAVMCFLESPTTKGRSCFPAKKCCHSGNADVVMVNYEMSWESACSLSFCHLPIVDFCVSFVA